MSHKLQLDSSVYSIEAVQKAAYKYIDRFASIISTDKSSIMLDITIDDKHLNDTDQILSDFKKELLDQNLRKMIKTETEPMRNYILAYTFSKSRLQS